uniref:VWFD domain-containing protein n=1 Tax=Pyrodinium bahamense TaxID=73915 RepID=A0A7S0FBF7_9DINO|mmetsp:Transcript_17724/g.48949  ORF Transcript_17724/g.48949 Transcript_17724/m.48949 type:complete len:407 (+) Transcript_17724:87-1307(+)
MAFTQANQSAFCSVLALCSLLAIHANCTECGANEEACAAVGELSRPGMEVVMLQRGLALGGLVAAAGDQCAAQQQCNTGISTSCTNGLCQVSCGGTVRCKDLHCPSGISSSCTNGLCTITCSGGSLASNTPPPLPQATGSCERYQCNTGISSSCTNGLCTLSCGGVAFCEDLSCPQGLSTSCSNGDCTINCNGGNQCTSGSCAVYSDPHVASFDSFREHELPGHLVLADVDACANQVRPIDVNSYNEGDFWLVRSSLLQVQGRFVLSKAFVPDHAAVGAVAAGGPFLDGKRLVVGTQSAVTWDGRALKPGNSLDLNLTRGVAHIRSHEGPVVDGKTSNVVTATLPLGVALYFVQFPKYIDTRITLPMDLKVDGECGNFNGVAADDTEEAVGRRMGGLQVAPKDSLF